MDEDTAWVFDSLICFLNGPVWNAPLQSFIEEKSLIFEPNVDESEEYRKIFDEFRNLVDFMLGSFMEDIGITPVQFEEACNQGNREEMPVHFDQNLFELIWAANDYEMFKRMMTHKNVELQLQALELIEQKYGITPESFIPKKKGNGHVISETKAEISPRPSIKSTNLEEEIMEEVLQNFPKETEDETDVKYLLEEKHILEETLKNIEGSSLPTSPTNEVKIEGSKDETKIETKDKNLTTNQESLVRNEKKGNALKEKLNRPTTSEITFDKVPQKNEVNATELKKRQEYLKAQRDKLVALKKEARKKHLDTEAVNKEKFKSRPKSAKAADDLLTGNSTVEIEPQQLQFRKALVERLKSEVMNKSKDN